MWSFIKKFGWRLAAIYYWIHFLAWIFGFGIEAIQLEHYLTNQLENFLLSIGAAPVSPVFLPIVIKTGWFLFITEFKPSLMIGFFFYLVFFPILFPILIILELNKIFKWKFTEQKSEETPTNNQNDNTEKNRKFFPFPLLISCGFCLLAWFLIFGDAKSVFISSIGVLLSGLLFLGLTSRLFIRARPVSNEKTFLFYWLEYPLKLPMFQIKQSKEKDLSKVDDIKTDIKFLSFFRKVVIYVANKLRSRNVQNKITFIALGEFIISMVIMATCAILFWALLIKALIPNEIELLTSLQLSVSYFLPAIEKPNINVSIPRWTEIGASSTSWIIFVLYLSPAGNLIPDKQKSYLKQLLTTQKIYKKCVFALSDQVKEQNLKLKYIELVLSKSQKESLTKKSN